MDSQASESNVPSPVNAFPLKRYYLDINSLVQKAKNYKPIYVSKKDLIKFKDRVKTKSVAGKYKPPVNDKLYRFGIICKANDPIIDITDYFSEQCRIQCRHSKNQYSVLDYYNLNKLKLVEQLPKLTFKALNELTYRKAGANCTNYKLPYLLGILHHFKPKRWLDLSAGWGDRLASALIYPSVEVYTAVDPNECLFPKYQEMVDTISMVDKTINIYETGAEVVPLETLAQWVPETDGRAYGYDFIMTSPAFFDKELYDESSPTQSMSKFDTEELWITEFLFKTVDKAWNLLSQGGNYIMYLEGESYVKRFVDYVMTKPGANYEGHIYQIFTDPRYPNKQGLSNTYRKVFWFSKSLPGTSGS
jgi:hypothetical protein